MKIEIKNDVKGTLKMIGGRKSYVKSHSIVLFQSDWRNEKTGELFCQAISETEKSVNLGCPEHEWKKNREERKAQKQEWDEDLGENEFFL